MPARSPCASWQGPTDAGYSGTVGGGRVLEWIDKAGYAAAAGWSGTYCVTAYVGNVRFTRPVEVGDLVEARAQIIHTGTSSMHILVTVSAGNPRHPDLLPTTECLMVFVAVGVDGRPDAVPVFEPQTDQDRAWQESALRRIDLRSEIAHRDGGPDLQPGGHGAADRACASSRLQRTSTGAARCTAASSCGGSTRLPTCSRPAGPAAPPMSPSTPAGCASTVRCASDTWSRSRRACCSPAPRACTSACTCAPATLPPAARPTMHSLIVFVPLDEDGNAVPTPTWEPVSEEDTALRDHALGLVALRHQIDAERHVP